MIDLHLHTTASDGRLTPGELVDRAIAARLSVMAVTDHDTTASVAEVQARATAAGIDAISGIEITAVDVGSDVHILGYFLDPAHAGLAAFLARQRTARIARVEAIAARLTTLGVPIDVAPLLAEARRESGRSIGRPQVARAMIAAGHVGDIREAFDRWLADGLPAFVKRDGPTPEAVIAAIHEAGGIASVAHPGKSIGDARLESLCPAGLDAVEAFHPDHDTARVAHYVRFAAAHQLLLSGGSDFHGDPSHERNVGAVGLPYAEWRRLSDARASVMSEAEPLVTLRAVIKDYRSLRPLRVASLDLHAGQSIALLGFDQAMAEVFVNLVTGAILPDTGDVRVMGQLTAAILDADTWLQTLDQFGLISERAVFLDQLTAEQNLAVPLSLELDELPADVATTVRALADEVGLGAAELRQPMGALSAAARLRVRLGRALALRPRVLLAEHPNALLPPADVAAFAADLARIIAQRRLASLVLTADATFAAAVADEVLTLQPATGVLQPGRGWRRWFS